MTHVSFYAPNLAHVETRSLLDVLLLRDVTDRRAYRGAAGRWYWGCSGRWVGVRVQWAIERAQRRVLARATAPPS